jgi:dihydroneopterin aldolase
LTSVGGHIYVPAVRSEYTIALRGLRFHARVGILPHERELPQPIEVDIAVTPYASVEQPSTGMLVDYRKLYDIAARVLGAGPIDFLEGVALGVAEGVLEGGSVERVRVAVRKLHVPLPGPLQHAEVCLELRRDE